MSDTQSTDKPVWLFDQFEISHTDVSDSGVIFTVRFVDFLGLTREVKVARSDCYFNFSEVLKLLVSQGFRFNTISSEAPKLIQWRLTTYRPDSKMVLEALNKAKETMSQEENHE